MKEFITLLLGYLKGSWGSNDIEVKEEGKTFPKSKYNIGDKITVNGNEMVVAGYYCCSFLGSYLICQTGFKEQKEIFNFHGFELDKFTYQRVNEVDLSINYWAETKGNKIIYDLFKPLFNVSYKHGVAIKFKDNTIEYADIKDIGEYKAYANIPYYYASTDGVYFGGDNPRSYSTKIFDEK